MSEQPKPLIGKRYKLSRPTKDNDPDGRWHWDGKRVIFESSRFEAGISVNYQVNGTFEDAIATGKLVPADDISPPSQPTTFEEFIGYTPIAADCEANAMRRAWHASRAALLPAVRELLEAVNSRSDYDACSDRLGMAISAVESTLGKEKK